MKWVPYAAVAAGAVLLVKVGIIFGTDGDEPAVTGWLYLAGLLLALATAIGFGLSRRRGRRTLVAVGCSLLVVAWVMVLSDALTPLFEVFSKKAYVGDEGPVALLGLVLLGLGARAGRSDERVPA